MTSGTHRSEGSLAQAVVLLALGVTTVGGISAFTAYLWHIYRLAFPALH